MRIIQLVLWPLRILLWPIRFVLSGVRRHGWTYWGFAVVGIGLTTAAFVAAAVPKHGHGLHVLAVVALGITYLGFGLSVQQSETVDQDLDLIDAALRTLATPHPGPVTQRRTWASRGFVALGMAFVIMAGVAALVPAARHPFDWLAVAALGVSYLGFGMSAKQTAHASDRLNVILTQVESLKASPETPATPTATASPRQETMSRWRVLGALVLYAILGLGA